MVHTTAAVVIDSTGTKEDDERQNSDALELDLLPSKTENESHLHKV